MKQKQLTLPYPELKNNSVSCGLLISSFFLLPVFSSRARTFFMPAIHPILAPLPEGQLFSSGPKGIPSTHAFHYCLNFFSAVRDCASTCQQSLLRREIQFFLRRKITGYFISPCSAHNTEMFNASSRWLIFLNGFQILACTSQHLQFHHTQSRGDTTRLYVTQGYVWVYEGGTIYVCLVEQAGQEQEAQAWNQTTLDVPSTKLFSLTEPQSSCL